MEVFPLIMLFRENTVMFGLGYGDVRGSLQRRVRYQSQRRAIINSYSAWDLRTIAAWDTVE
jgi:hypothetical protein